MSERNFKCEKCESTDIHIKYKDYISHFSHDERVAPFLACTCKRCEFFWRAKTSDEN